MLKGLMFHVNIKFSKIYKVNLCLVSPFGLCSRQFTFHNQASLNKADQLVNGSSLSASFSNHHFSSTLIISFFFFASCSICFCSEGWLVWWLGSVVGYMFFRSSQSVRVHNYYMKT